MLQLTPFKETKSFREAAHEELTDLLLRQIKRKYRFGDRTLAQLARRFQQLSLENLEALFEEMIDMQTLGQLNEWLDEHTTNETDLLLQESR
ncbi:MAG: DUF4351 domain-containing protein [Caldilineaceae bacterium]